ncbi:MAG: YceI family protein [Legionella longbeachae]|nr:YceI family protein [Legionella longbeachae]
MKIIKYFFLFMILYAAVANASTLPQWTIVPDESSLSFTATQNNAPVSGSFKHFTGQIFVDPAHYQDSSIEIVVDMNSISTSYAEITSIILGSDWFNVKEFPKAEFKSTKITKKDDQTYDAVGTLTIKNKSVPVTLTFTAVESPKNHLLIDGHTLVKRTAFGIGQGEWASTNEIKDDVTVNFKVVAIRKE